MEERWYQSQGVIGHRLEIQQTLSSCEERRGGHRTTLCGADARAEGVTLGNLAATRFKHI